MGVKFLLSLQSTTEKQATIHSKEGSKQDTGEHNKLPRKQNKHRKREQCNDKTKCKLRVHENFNIRDLGKQENNLKLESNH